MIKLAYYKELIQNIQKLRKYMYELIEEKGELLDTEVIEVSKKIDKMLNEYEKLIVDKNND